MAEDLAAFAARLLRFDPGALIRLRDGQAWARLPWDVLVCVPVETSGPRVVDSVISAADGKPRDAQWRGALPAQTARTVEILPAAAVRDAAEAAANTLREVSLTGLRGRSVGQRAVRDALLDHPVITGTSDEDGTAFVVPQRIVQAIVRMELLSGDNVGVLVSGPWTGLGTRLGSAWHRASQELTVRPLR